MPDWSYRTLFRPLLNKMSPRNARTFTLRAMGAVGRMPGGSLLIRTLGHAEPSPLLETKAGPLRFPSPVGLSGEVDPEGIAGRALSQLGFGFVEIGPVTPHAHPVSPVHPEADQARETLLYLGGAEWIGCGEAERRIRHAGHQLPIFVRLAPVPDCDPSQAAGQIGEMIGRLSLAGAAGFTVDLLSARPARAWRPEECQAVLNGIPPSPGKPLLLYIPADYPDDQLPSLIRMLDPVRWTGAVIGIGNDPETGHLAAGPFHLEAVCRKIRLIRRAAPHNFAIQAAAGIHEPHDALCAMEAGADQVLLNSGFVYGGPGLPKRIRDAVLHGITVQAPEPAATPFWQNWGWMCLLGIGMIVGGAIAWLIAVSSVLLPYDESFLGMSREELRQLNPHLLHFMSHDRITLAGTMVSLGILYYQLAKHGLRHGMHWTRTAVLLSCAVGFPSFFLYLGYGFFDPLHAAAAAVLLPMFLLSLRQYKDQPPREPVNLRSDLTWRRAMWGQLCFVVLGVSLAIGGLTIAGVGVTRVFVPTDLAYLGLTAAELDAYNPRIIPLIAHDRAGFGGALLADALVLSVIALWGIQQGARWLWKTLLAGGAPAFFAAISVHFEIGYTDAIHLLPAYFAVFLYIAGLILLYPYMMHPPEPYSSPGTSSAHAASDAAASSSS